MRDVPLAPIAMIPLKDIDLAKNELLEMTKK